MSKVSMKRTKELINVQIAADPAIGEGKRLAGVLLLVAVGLRVLTLLSELVCAVGGMIEFNPANVGSLVVSILFAYMIYQGIGVLAYLPVIGGVVMVIQAFLYDYLTVILSNEYWPQARIYAFLFLINGLYQIGAFLFLVLNRKTKLYFAAYKQAEATIRAENTLQK